jgi:hypothetical protein
MHFTASWHINVEGEKLKQINDLMVEVVKKQAETYFSPYPGFIFAKMDSQEKWEIVLNGLKGLCKMYEGKINFVMSPLFVNGKYNGHLANWTQINDITK